MKAPNLIVPLLAGLCLSANAGLYQNLFTSGFASGGNIPDGTSAGWTDAHAISGISDDNITGISVKLNFSGGFNGDLYGYLSYNGVQVPLLNRVGVSSGNSFGYSDSGFNITLSDSGTYGDIHLYQQVSGYSTHIADGSSWTPDGRNIDPLSSQGSFDTASRVTLGSYNNLNPNGTWTLFIADMSSGGGQSQLVGWELDITAVPEPVNVALVIFTGLFVLTGLCRTARVRRLWED